MAILLTYGTARILLAGDAEANEEEYMANGPYTGPLTIIMEPGVDARSLRFSPLFTRVLGVLAGLTISFSERRYSQRASSAR